MSVHDDYDGAPPLNFHNIDAMVRELGFANVVASRSHTSTRPPYWGPLDDSDEGRKELARRFAAVLQSSEGLHIHSDQRTRLAAAWLKEQGITHV